MTTPHPTVRLATVEDADPIADLLADAFLDYEWSRWAVPADDRRERLRGLHLLHVEEAVGVSVTEPTRPARRSAPWGVIADLRPSSVVLDELVVVAGELIQGLHDGHERVEGLDGERAHAIGLAERLAPA